LPWSSVIVRTLSVEEACARFWLIPAKVKKKFESVTTFVFFFSLSNFHEKRGQRDHA
jgi:hypothetical protein